MQNKKQPHHHHHLLLVICLSVTTLNFAKSTTFCGNTRIESPFLPSNTTNSNLNNLLLCKFNTLYFQTSIGLFKVSAIDYKAKTLTIDHSSCSASPLFISPLHLLAGFSSPPEPNSLLLFNCSNHTSFESSALRSCTDIKSYPMFCGENHFREKQSLGSSCLVVDDVGELGKDFGPEKMKCTHYRRVYRRSSAEVEIGTRISFDVHVTNPCDECRKPYGNCGVGLKCMCHISECKDKVINGGSILIPSESTITIIALGLVGALIN